MRTRAIYGLSATALTAEERAFFADARPFGFILFGRNIATPEQVAALVASLKALSGDARTPVLIDQEGGRVARLKPPHWPAREPAARFADLHARDPEAAREAAYLHARLIAAGLYALGINVDCTPVLDVPVEGAHDIIGDRAWGRDPATVIDLARSVIDGMLEGGVLPVMKHIPGHGRAESDSHLALPRVTAPADELSASDFVPFRSLNHCPMAMTAHVVYESIDAQRPATTSPKIVRDVIRGEIGFDGLLMSDDVSMQALSGPISVRTKAALFAGCDVALHCNGGMDEMKDVAEEAGPLDGPWLKRAEAALSHLSTPEAFDLDGARARLEELLRGSQ